jgi:hypothetical protein
MSLGSDLDDAAATMTSAIQAARAAGVSAAVIVPKCISVLRMSDAGMSREINDSGTRYTSGQPVDRRSFATIIG